MEQLNNIKTIRELAGVAAVTVSHLLNMNHYGYLLVEKGCVDFEKIQELLFRLMFKVDIKDMYNTERGISVESKAYLEHIASLEESKRYELLCLNLSDGKKKKLNYRDVRNIMEKIEKDLSRNHRNPLIWS